MEELNEEKNRKGNHCNCGCYCDKATIDCFNSLVTGIDCEVNFRAVHVEIGYHRFHCLFKIIYYFPNLEVIYLLYISFFGNYYSLSLVIHVKFLEYYPFF